MSYPRSSHTKNLLPALSLDGGLYVCNLSSLEVDLLLKNNSESCKEIKRICAEFENGLPFIESGDRKVNFFCPSENNYKTLMSSGQEEASDGTDETFFYASLWHLFYGEDSIHIGYCYRLHRKTYFSWTK